MINFRSSPGFTLIEVIITVFLAAMMMCIAIINLNEFSSPSLNGAAQLMGFFKQARGKAISTTSAYLISAASSTRVVTEVTETCSSGTSSPDETLTLDLPTGASMPDTSWSVCFNSRGLADSNISVPVTDTQSGSHIVEILLGGTVRLD